MPELAESWEASADVKTWVFKIRTGVEFHNGKTLTAEDVVYSLNLHRAEDSKSSVRPIMSGISEIKATAPNEVTISLAEPNAGLPSVMAMFNLIVVPDGETDFAAGIGTGGYILENFEQGVRSLVKRNPNYWKEDRAHFDAVEILAVKDSSARTTGIITNDLDAINFVEPKTAGLLAKTSDVEILQTPGKAHYCYSLRTDMAPADQSDVRLALKYAIDREDFLNKILKGYGSLGNDQPLSKAYASFDDSIEQRIYDPDKARSLMRKAGALDHVFKLHVSDTPFSGAVDGAALYSEHAAKAGNKN